MVSNGRRKTREFGAFAAAAFGALVTCAIAVSLIRFVAVVRDSAERDSAREAELDGWAHSNLS